jgi:two-component system nitrate/nitrite response regulator NarL
VHAVTELQLVVLDDVALYRDGLKTILSGRDGLRVIGVGTADREGVNIVRSLSPDVVLIEASSVHSTTIVQDLTRLAPVTPILAYGVGAEDREAVHCAEAGLSAYVPRNATTPELIEAIQSVARGEFACSPRVGALLMRRISDLTSQSGSRPTHVVLTPRERQIGELIDDGLSNKEIARRLGIGVSTVKNHVHNLLEKLHVVRRCQAGAQIRRARV